MINLVAGDPMYVVSMTRQGGSSRTVMYAAPSSL